jgi:hypothetical protein
MSGRDAANAFLADVGAGGGGGGPVGAMSADAGMGLGSKMTMKFRVEGNILSDQLYDQASFFGILTAQALGDDYQLADVTPSAQRFSNAQVSDYLSLNPMIVLNANFPNVSGSDAAAATSSIAAVIRRFNPFNQNAQDQIDASDKQTAADFQNNRVQIPFAEKLDGYTEINIVNDQQATAVSYTVAWIFGGRIDRRVEVADQAPVLVRSPSSIR